MTLDENENVSTSTVCHFNVIIYLLWDSWDFKSYQSEGYFQKKSKKNQLNLFCKVSKTIYILHCTNIWCQS